MREIKKRSPASAPPPDWDMYVEATKSASGDTYDV
jgi:hypothetical protein